MGPVVTSEAYGAHAKRPFKSFLDLISRHDFGGDVSPIVSKSVQRGRDRLSTALSLTESGTKGESTSNKPLRYVDRELL